jgi:hypothetical protein
MKIKTTELIGPALDWAVATFEGLKTEGGTVITNAVYLGEDLNTWPVEWNPSEDWAQGGPIIEQSLIVLSPDPSLGWTARSYMDAVTYSGPTALVAAMRCYVASKLGNEVEIPEELLT